MDYQDKLTLMADILKNQQQLGYGTTDEYSQIHRLAESLKEQGHFDENMQQTLASISAYCASGNCAEKAPQINQWLSSINEMTLPYSHE
ncbi:MAG: YtzH-like family protein [Anaerobacillus sp.]|uniref:YtzH-like family protein n=1 Tax=Anaerobacillus sp. TaxID=1872506 RepID=UPI003919E9E5